MLGYSRTCNSIAKCLETDMQMLSKQTDLQPVTTNPANHLDLKRTFGLKKEILNTAACKTHQIEILKYREKMIKRSLVA